MLHGSNEAGIELLGGSVRLTISDAETGEVLLPATTFVETGTDPDILLNTNTSHTTTAVTGGGDVPYAVRVRRAFYVLTFAPTSGSRPTVSRLFRYAWQGSTNFANGTFVGPDFYDPEGAANTQIDSCFRLVAGRMKAFAFEFRDATGSNQFIDDYVGGERWTLPYDAYPAVSADGFRLGQFFASDVSLDTSGCLLPQFYIGRGLFLDGNYSQTWQDVPGLRLRFLPGAYARIQGAGALTTHGVTFEPAAPATTWNGFAPDYSFGGGTLTLGPGTSVLGASVTTGYGGRITLDGATVSGSTGAGVNLLFGKPGFSPFVRVTGGTVIQNSAGAGIQVAAGSVVVDDDAVIVQNNAGGILATGTGASALVTGGSFQNNTGPAFRATSGGRIDIYRSTGGGGSSSLTPNGPVLATLNAGGLYGSSVSSKQPGGRVNSGDYLCTQPPCPSIGQHSFVDNNLGPALDAEARVGGSVIAIQNYWGQRPRSAIETFADGSSYLAIDPILNAPPSATAGDAAARTAGAGDLAAAASAPADARGAAFWDLLRDAEARAQTGDTDGAAAGLVAAYRRAGTNDERLAAAEAAARTLSQAQPAALLAWADGAASLPGRDRPWARRALAVALLAQGQAAAAAGVAQALADEDGAGTSPLAQSHRARGLSLRVESAIAAGDGPAAHAALAALTAVDPEGAATLALAVAMAFPDAPTPFAPEPDALAATATETTVTVHLAVGPNPSAGAVTVALAVEAGAEATVVVFDALGRAVRTLHDGAATGPLALAFNGGDLPAGVYVVRAVVRHADGRVEIAARTLTLAR